MPTAKRFDIETGQVVDLQVSDRAIQLREAEGQPSLEDVRKEALEAVEKAANRRRYSEITPGMEVVYQDKAEEARAVLALGQAAADALTEAEYTSQFPTLSASIGTEAASLWEVAQLVKAAKIRWLNLSRNVEAQRLALKNQIRNATDIQTIYQLRSTIT